MATGRAKTSRRAAALLVASAVVVLAAACGSSSDSSSSGGRQPAGNRAGNNAIAAYVQCLQENGVSITMPAGGPRERPSDGASRGPRPDGSRGPGRDSAGRGGPGLTKPDGVDDTTWQKAQTACASVKPADGGDEGNAG